MKPREPKLLFDECIPTPSLAQIVNFVSASQESQITIKHLLELAPSGVLDEVWVPRLKDEAWTVISADGARRPNRNRGRNLPRLCAEYGLTLIVLSPTVHNRKVFDKARTVISVWSQIVEIASDPKCDGKRYMLEPLNQENPGVGRLSERTIYPNIKPPT